MSSMSGARLCPPMGSTLRQAHFQLWGGSYFINTLKHTTELRALLFYFLKVLYDNAHRRTVLVK